MPANHAFAGYPAPFIYGEDGKEKLQQLIWGDLIRITGAPKDGGSRCTRGVQMAGCKRPTSKMSEFWRFASWTSVKGTAPS